MDFIANARVYQGQWIVDCPHPYCFNADGVPVDGDPMREGSLASHRLHGTPLLLVGDNHWKCLECGTEYSIRWPRNVKRIDKVLAKRRVAQTRNWEPGETVADLEEQNAVLDSLGL